MGSEAVIHVGGAKKLEAAEGSRAADDGPILRIAWLATGHGAPRYQLLHSAWTVDDLIRACGDPCAEGSNAARNKLREADRGILPKSSHALGAPRPPRIQLDRYFVPDRT